MSVLARDAMSETFSDLEGLIRAAAWNFSQKYRMDVDDCRSLAYEAFVESFGGKYDPKRGSFTAYILQRVRSKLLEAHRTLMRRVVLGKVVNYNPMNLQSRDDQAFIDWKFNLPKDAQTVVDLVIDAPREIVQAMVTSNHNPIVARKEVAEYLSDIGWVADRISESFNEIAEAL